MKIRYSPSTGTFYPYDIAYATIPADVMDVADAEYHRAQTRKPGETFSFDAAGTLAFVLAPAVNPNDAINAQIAAMEAAVFLNRGSRELQMRQIEQAASGNPIALAAQPYYVKLKALDDQIRALRAQIK